MERITKQKKRRIKQINRIEAIDACLNSKNFPHITMKVLLKYLEERHGIITTVDTVQKDISKMKTPKPEGYGTPIHYNKYTNTYYYDDGEGNRIYDYALNQLPLDVKDIKSFQIAADIISQFQNRGLGADFDEALTKITNFVKFETETQARNIIVPELTKGKQTFELIPEMYEYIKNKKAITFTYGQTVDLLTSKQTVHPYLLKEYNKAWYLIGYSETEEWILPYDLEFIDGKIVEANMPYYEFNKFDYKEHFKNTIGVNVLSNNLSKEKVTLQFMPDEAQFVLRHPIHRTQKVISQETSAGHPITFTIEVYTSQELIDLILSYGDRVAVIEPTMLRNALTNDLQRAIENNKAYDTKREINEEDEQKMLKTIDEDFLNFTNRKI